MCITVNISSEHTAIVMSFSLFSQKLLKLYNNLQWKVHNRRF